jgi:hypothetical protein
MKRLLSGKADQSASLVSMETEEKSEPNEGRKGGQFSVSEFFPPLSVVSDAGLQLEACQKPMEGVCLADLYAHSHKASGSSWVWIQKGDVLDHSLGFRATQEEIQRFGSRARIIYKCESRKVDSRSFLQVARMENSRQGVEGGRGARNQGGGGGGGRNFDYNDNYRGVALVAAVTEEEGATTMVEEGESLI